MLGFRTLKLSDREWIHERLKKADLMGCDYSFANNFIWGTQYNLEIADVDGFYITKVNSQKETVYGFPIGDGNLKGVLEKMMEDAKERGIPFMLRGILNEHVTLLDLLMPGQFTFTESRDECDYIYTVEKLAKLAGKKLHGKRNHIARFKDNDNWCYEKITRESIPECLSMNDKWCKKYHEENESIKHEACAVKKAFENYEELGFTGGLLRLNGEVIAYTVGEPLNHNTFVIHFEKAFGEIQGAYPMINQQFVLAECMDYEYVNREEDLGEEGLRKAKLSYHPDILLDRYTATLKQ